MEDKIPEIIEKEFWAKVLDVKRITEGYSHYMYDVKIDKEPWEMIVRFANNFKPNVSLAKEKFVMELARENGIPAPKIHAFHYPEDNKKEGYIIMEKFKGKRLDTIWDSLTKGEKVQVTVEMGSLLKKMHLITFDDFGEIEEGYVDKDVAFEFREMGEKIPHSKFLRPILVSDFKGFARFLSYKHLSPEFVAKFFGYVMSKLDVIDYSGKPVLAHTDFIPGHVFVEKVEGKYEIVGVIDFEFARAASPDFDFIKLHREGFFEDRDLVKALKIGYGEINEEAVIVHRVMRDFGFAWVLLESGDKELSDKILKSIEDRIDQEKRFSG